LKPNIGLQKYHITSNAPQDQLGKSWRSDIENRENVGFDMEKVIIVYNDYY